ncbi:MAG: substrate-binding domain-containing protein [Solirubrobacteraceae bacterium]
MALAVTAIALSGCGNSSTRGHSSTQRIASGTSRSCNGKHYTVAMVPAVTPLSFYDTMERAAAAEAQKLCMTIIYQGPATFGADPETQVLDAVLVKHPDALVVAPADPSAIQAPIERFEAAGIPVFGIDLALRDPSVVKSQVLGNNYQGGQLSAAALGTLMHGSGAAAPLNTARGIPTLDLRYQGFAATMHRLYPRIQVLPQQYAGATPSQAQTLARDLLLAHPNLKAFFCITEVQAEGAAAAIAALGKQGKVFVSTYDGDPTEVQDLKSGKIQFLAVQQVKKEGQTVVDYVHDWLTGKQTAVPKEVTIDTVAVTKANVDSPQIAPILYGPASH